MERILGGIVLRYTHFGETSAILNVLTKDSGIASVLLHGVKNHGGNYGVGAVVEWHVSKRYAEKEGLAKTSKYEIFDNFSFNGNIEKVALRDCAVELILQVVPQEFSDSRDLYSLLEKYLKYLDSPDCELFFALWLFCVRLAQFLGYKINFSNCIACGNDLNFSFLSQQNGGFLCEKCHAKPNWSGEILKILSKGDANPGRVTGKLSLKEKIFISEQLISYIQYHCGKKERPLKSFEFFCKYADESFC